MKKYKMEPYNEDTGQGFFRHVLIRTGHAAGEIIGYSADASLIEKALLSCRYSLNDIKIFHSDRGREYDNIKINLRD